MDFICLNDDSGLLYLVHWICVILVLFHLTKFSWSLIQGYELYVFSQFSSRRDGLKKYGQWVMISGGTDGIGLAMARELARDGHSILVIGRSEEKLAATKSILEGEPNVGEVAVVRIDLSDSSPANYERIRDEIDADKRDIGILLNCAGTCEASRRRYHNADMAYIQGQVNVQIMAPLHFTRMVLPGMVERGRGLVVNFSSQLSIVPMPFYGVYSPTKAFVDLFSRALEAEYAGYPINVVNLTIGPVASKLLAVLSAANMATVFSPKPEVYARSCLNALASGVTGNVSGYWMHGLMFKGLQLLAYFGLEPILCKLNLMLDCPDKSQLTPKSVRKTLVAKEDKITIQ